MSERSAQAKGCWPRVAAHRIIGPLPPPSPREDLRDACSGSRPARDRARGGLPRPGAVARPALPARLRRGLRLARRRDPRAAPAGAARGQRDHGHRADDRLLPARAGARLPGRRARGGRLPCARAAQLPARRRADRARAGGAGGGAGLRAPAAGAGGLGGGGVRRAVSGGLAARPDRAHPHQPAAPRARRRAQRGGAVLVHAGILPGRADAVDGGDAVAGGGRGGAGVHRPAARGGAGARPRRRRPYAIRRGGARNRARGAGGQPRAAAAARDRLRHLPRRGGGDPRLRGPGGLPHQQLAGLHPRRRRAATLRALHPPPARPAAGRVGLSRAQRAGAGRGRLHAVAPRAAQSLRVCRHRPRREGDRRARLPARAGARRVRRRGRARPPARHRRASRRSGGRRL